jgi:hypothetical protein
MKKATRARRQSAKETVTAFNSAAMLPGALAAGGRSQNGDNRAIFLFASIFTECVVVSDGCIHTYAAREQ